MSIVPTSRFADQDAVTYYRKTFIEIIDAAWATSTAGVFINYPILKSPLIVRFFTIVAMFFHPVSTLATTWVEHMTPRRHPVTGYVALMSCCERIRWETLLSWLSLTIFREYNQNWNPASVPEMGLEPGGPEDYPLVDRVLDTCLWDEIKETMKTLWSLNAKPDISISPVDDSSEHSCLTPSMCMGVFNPVAFTLLCSLDLSVLVRVLHSFVGECSRKISENRPPQFTTLIGPTKPQGLTRIPLPSDASVTRKILRLRFFYFLLLKGSCGVSSPAAVALDADRPPGRSLGASSSSDLEHRAEHLRGSSVSKALRIKRPVAAAKRPAVTRPTRSRGKAHAIQKKKAPKRKSREPADAVDIENTDDEDELDDVPDTSDEDFIASSSEEEDVSNYDTSEGEEVSPSEGAE